jgi:hypothetical protein
MKSEIKIAYVFQRINMLRHGAPLIKGALKRGWTVECWLDHSEASLKAKQGPPHWNDFPDWIQKNCTPISYDGEEDLELKIGEKEVDVVFNILPPRGKINHPWKGDPSKRPLMVLQDGAASDWTFHIRSRENFNAVDLFSLSTSFWIDETVKQITRYHKNLLKEEDIKDFVENRVSAHGWLPVDGVDELDTLEIKRRYGINPQKKVVTLLNWSLGFNELGGRFKAYVEPKRIDRLKSMFKSKTSLRDICEGFFDQGLFAMIKSIKHFCDRNDAALIIKFRERDRSKEIVYQKEAADVVLFEECFYPLTILEAAKISDLSIGFVSWGVRECVAAGSPHLAINVMGFAERVEPMPFCRENIKDGGMFNFPKVVWYCNEKKAIEKLNSARIEEFKSDSEKREQYFRKFIGMPSEDQTANLLNEVECRLKNKKSF